MSLFDTIFRLVENILKVMNPNVHPDAIWYDILTCWEKNESNAAKWCILTLFESNVRRHLGIQDTHHPPSFFIAFFFSSYEMKCMAFSGL